MSSSIELDSVLEDSDDIDDKSADEEEDDDNLATVSVLARVLARYCNFGSYEGDFANSPPPGGSFP